MRRKAAQRCNATAFSFAAELRTVQRLASLGSRERKSDYVVSSGPGLHWCARTSFNARLLKSSGFGFFLPSLSVKKQALQSSRMQGLVSHRKLGLIELVSNVGAGLFVILNAQRIFFLYYARDFFKRFLNPPTFKMKR